MMSGAGEAVGRLQLTCTAGENMAKGAVTVEVSRAGP